MSHKNNYKRELFSLFYIAGMTHLYCVSCNYLLLKMTRHKKGVNSTLFFTEVLDLPVLQRKLSSHRGNAGAVLRHIKYDLLIYENFFSIYNVNSLWQLH